MQLLTVEILADDGTITIGAILSDASSGAIISDDGQAVVGYAAYGRSVRSAVEPLVGTFDIRLYDDGQAVRSSSAPPQRIGNDELGCSPDGAAAARMEREQLPAHALPTVLRIGFYDPGRDYQSGEARASIGPAGGQEEQQELPAVLDAGAAKSLAQQLLARRWARRDLLTLRLPPNRIVIEPGTTLELDLSPTRWLVEKSSIDGFSAVVELRPLGRSAVQMQATAARILASPDVPAAEMRVALFELPEDVTGTGEPSLMLAASSSAPGWRRGSVDVRVNGRPLMVPTARKKAIIGQTATVLPAMCGKAADVEIELVDPDQWLMSCDQAALASGSNLALIGNELIQFGQATPIALGSFRLERLLRGRFGTSSREWSAGERFVLIEPEALQPVRLPLAAVGTEVSAVAGDGVSTIRWTGSRQHAKKAGPEELGELVTS